jgi:hypothetical protein
MNHHQSLNLSEVESRESSIEILTTADSIHSFKVNNRGFKHSRPRLQFLATPIIKSWFVVKVKTTAILRKEDQYI